MRALFQSVTQFLKRLLRRGLLSRARAEAGCAEGASADSDKAVPDELKRLVYHAACRIDPDQRVHASRMGALLREQDPSFSYEKYRFTKLIDLLRALPELVALEKIEPQRIGKAPSSRRLAPVYYVRSRFNSAALIKACSTSFESPASVEPLWVHWQSLAEAIVQKVPDFSVSRYGFSSFKDFLASHNDLIEFKVDSPDYLRIRSEQSASSPGFTVRSRTRPKPTIARPNLRSIEAREERKHDERKPIESLLQFTGLSVEDLNQKVSELAAIALPETWYFGPQPPENFAYPILKSYVRYTFVRLQHEDKVLTSANQQYRAFNTGLLDTLLRPIYGLLTYAELDAAKVSYADRSDSVLSGSEQPESEQPESEQSQKRWTLEFCIAGEDYVGKTLVSEFSQLPVAANYFENADKAFYYLGEGAPTVDWQHVVKDNMARLPLAFLERYAPKGFVPRSTQQMNTSEFYEYKRSFITALEADPSGYRHIVSRLEEALAKTLRRTQINYTTAVPTYYPKINSIDLLLPMCLVNEHIVDLALVVRREPSGKYIGHTILTMRQAYNNARLICKLDNHWLPQAMTLSQNDCLQSV